MLFQELEFSSLHEKRPGELFVHVLFMFVLAGNGVKAASVPRSEQF
jgi:hypothetical protein